MMGTSKTHHGLAVLLCLILMFFQFSLVSSVDDNSTSQLESSTTDGPTDSTTTPLPTDPPTMTTTTTTTPPPETNAPTSSSEPNLPTSTLDGTSTTAGPSTTTDTTTSEATTTSQPTSTSAPTPTTSPTTTSSSSGSTNPPASSGDTSLPSSPGAEPHSTTESAGPGTVAVSSTTVSTESSASPEGSGSATSTLESSVSVLTSTPPSPTVTSTATVTVTTTAAATTTAKHAYPTKKPEKPFRLDFEVGDSNASTVYCTDNCAFKTILEDVQTAFSSVPGYLYVESGDSAANRRRRDTRFSVAVLFDQGMMVILTADDRTEAVYVAFQTLGNFSSVQVQIDQVNDTIVAGFVERTADMCKVPNTCPLGYRCSQGVCYHLCENHDCSSNGVCQAVVDTDGSSRATCVCNSGYEHTYSGAHCENEKTSDAKKAAIVGGVLGTFCAIFLILILFLYCRLRESDGGSKRNYQLGGYSNNGYADQEFAMRNPASDDP